MTEIVSSKQDQGILHYSVLVIDVYSADPLDLYDYS